LPLLWLFLQERVKNLAREESERSLADYRHQHDLALAALNAERQRTLYQYSLFTAKQHRVYASLFASYRKAVDLYAGLVGVYIGPDFTTFTLEDAKKWLQINDVAPGQAAPVLDAFERGGRDAPGLLNGIDHRLRAGRASEAFRRAKNAEALNVLYFSDEAQRSLSILRLAVAAVASIIQFDRQLVDRTLPEKSRAMEQAAGELFRVLRTELRQEPAAGPAEPGPGAPAA